MSAAERITALEAEVAELRAFVPMLARMAFYESYAGRSVPTMILGLEDLAGVPHETLHQSYSPLFERPQDEELPASAEALQDEQNRLDLSGGLTAWWESQRKGRMEAAAADLSAIAELIRDHEAGRRAPQWVDSELHRVADVVSRAS